MRSTIAALAGAAGVSEETGSDENGDDAFPRTLPPVPRFGSMPPPPTADSF